MTVFSYKNDFVSAAHYPTLAAIDIGTNSCRLLVASVNVARLSRNYFSAKQNFKGWKAIDSFARIVRLGEGLHKTSALSPVAINRTIEALSICRNKLEKYGISRIRAVATEACRQASNGHALVERARDELNLKIDIISGLEEARLILTGCASLLNPRIAYGAVFDIGGGSTEMIWIRLTDKGKRRPGYPIPFEILASTSIPYGVVTCTESLRGFGDQKAIYDYVRSQVRYELTQFFERNNIYSVIESSEFQLLGSSGTVTTLAAIQNGLDRYDRHHVDRAYIKTEDLRQLCATILSLSSEERIKHPCIGKGRSDLIIAGSAILEGIFDAVPAHEMRVADRGVREGILSELLLSLNKREHIFDPSIPIIAREKYECEALLSASS